MYGKRAVSGVQSVPWIELIAFGLYLCHLSLGPNSTFDQIDGYE